MSAGKIIRMQVKNLELEVKLVEEIRSAAKTEGGHLTDFGRGFIALAKDAEMKQALVAKILDISAGAVSNHYAKV